MATYTPNYNLEKPDAIDPFGDFRESYNDNLDIIDASLGGGGGSGGHTIVDPDGNSLPQEDELQFTGAVSVTDDNVNGRTVVNVSGGSNLILDAQIYSTEEKQVGVWRDKKPLYQKTIVLNNEITVSNTAWTSTGVTASSLDVETYVRCVAQNSGGTCWDAVNVATIGGYISLTAWRNGDTIGVKEFTIQYTKTTDTAGSGGYEAYGFSPVIYSDVERVIGVWRDNKPLYQKTLVYTVTSPINSNTVLGSISDIDMVASIEGIAHYEGYGRGWLLPLSMSGYSSNISYNNGDIILNITNDTYGVDWAFYVTVQYTKTTDVVGSGDYNTYGVPTHHYSTSEQVIGTWTNGKPCYEITLEDSGSFVSNTEHIIPLPLNADNVRIMSGFVDIGTDWLPISLTLGLGTGTTNGIYCYPNKSNGLHLFSSAWTFTKYSIVIQYTKTTD